MRYEENYVQALKEIIEQQASHILHLIRINIKEREDYRRDKERWGKTSDELEELKNAINSRPKDIHISE